MEIVKTLQDASAVADPAVRALIERRIQEWGEQEPLGGDSFGYFLVCTRATTTADLTAQLDFDVLCNRYSGIAFGQPGFAPSFELIEEHPDFYELVFVLDDSGFGVDILIPKDHRDANLIEMCRQYALPSEEPT